MTYYETNALGDVVVAVADDGVQRSVNPSDWGWLKPGGRNDPAESRRSVDSLRDLPGFSVDESKSVSFVPGPRSRGARWMEWEPGTAPPAAVDSDRGTRGYYGRLSEAAGHVALTLASRARGDRIPVMTIWDFVGVE